MRMTDIRSPGFVPNSLPLHHAVVKAVSFVQIQGPESAEAKAKDLIAFFQEAITELEKFIPKHEPVVIPSHYQALPAPTVQEAPRAVKSTKSRKG